jgi:hypothetical protein
VKKPHAKDKYCMIHSYEAGRTFKFIETEGTSVVTSSWGKESNEELLFNM